MSFDKLFCRACESLLPSLTESPTVTCRVCKKKYDTSELDGVKYEYYIEFNSISRISKENEDKDTIQGPTVEKKCAKCGCEKMSYATLQLRSADEGQTIFYTCIDCKYTEIENS